MGKYTQDAQQLLRLIGGKENIAAVSHCVTRMRFVLNDPSKADVEAIEAMKVVKGSFTQAGQFQVIIGNAVADFYNLRSGRRFQGCSEAGSKEEPECSPEGDRCTGRDLCTADPGDHHRWSDPGISKLY